MGMLFTLAVLLVLVLLVAVKARRAGALAAETARKKAEAARKRAEAEEAVRQSVDGAKKRDALSSAAKAIEKDPERAARVVEKLLRRRD